MFLRGAPDYFDLLVLKITGEVIVGERLANSASRLSKDYTTSLPKEQPNVDPKALNKKDNSKKEQKTTNCVIL